SLRVAVGHRSNFGLPFDALYRGLDRIVQFGAKSRPLRFVPLHCVGELFGGWPNNPGASSHRPRIAFSIRRFTSSQDSSLALPAFRSVTRRSISACQASSASGSLGPSRLASISAASCARESASSRRASASTASVAFVISVIYAEGEPPNKRI